MKYSGIPYYRTQIISPLKKFRLVYKQTDLLVLADNELVEETLSIVMEVRKPLEAYILNNPLFLKSLEPLPDDPQAPEIVRKMLYAGQVAGVGPMASVAGAIAEAVGRKLLERGLTEEVVIENGGDIFLSLKKEAKVVVFAGDTIFSGKIALLIPQDIQPCGICTSSGKVGHSLSFGKAEAVTVVHKDTAVADALATYIGNIIKSKKDLIKIESLMKKDPDIYGVSIVLKDRFALYSSHIRFDVVNREELT